MNTGRNFEYKLEFSRLTVRSESRARHFGKLLASINVSHHGFFEPGVMAGSLWSRLLRFHSPNVILQAESQLLTSFKRLAAPVESNMFEIGK